MAGSPGSGASSRVVAAPAARRARKGLGGLALGALLALGPGVAAQSPCPCPPAPPEPAWKGSLGAGLSLTSGNSDTRAYNLSLTASHDPKRRNVFKADGLYLRSDQAGRATADKTSANLRDEYRVDGRLFVFAELRYLRDAFKEIDYLASPLAGFGYRVVDGDRLAVAVDGAVGGQFERARRRGRTTDGALQAGQSVVFRLSPTATLSQRASGLWKTSGLGDALYHIELGLAATLSRRFELKLAFADDYKTRPADPRIDKNDSSLVAALVFKVG